MTEAVDRQSILDATIIIKTRFINVNLWGNLGSFLIKEGIGGVSGQKGNRSDDQR